MYNKETFYEISASLFSLNQTVFFLSMSVSVCGLGSFSHNTHFPNTSQCQNHLWLVFSSFIKKVPKADSADSTWGADFTRLCYDLLRQSACTPHKSCHCSSEKQSECGTVFKMFDWTPWNVAVLLTKDLGQTCVHQNLYLHSQVQKVSWPVIIPVPAMVHHLSASPTCSPVPTHLSIPAIHIPPHFHLLPVRESKVFLSVSNASSALFPAPSMLFFTHVLQLWHQELNGFNTNLQISWPILYPPQYKVNLAHV